MSNLPPSPSEHGCSTHCCDSQDCCSASCRCVCYTSHTVQTRLLGSARRSCVSPVMSACHRYYADIIIGLLQDVALQAALHPYEELDASQFQTPPPMYDNNLESTTTCLRGDLLQQRVYQAVVCFPPIHGCLSVYPSVCLSVRPSVCLSVRLAVWQYLCLSCCLSECLDVSTLVGNNACSRSSKCGTHGGMHGGTARLVLVLHMSPYLHVTSFIQKQQMTG